jgi:tetratricopeptide (TPR) repeat protein
MRKKNIFLFSLLFLCTASFFFSQANEAQKILENSRAGVVSLTAYGNNKQIVGQGSGFVLENGVIATDYLMISQAVAVDGKNCQGKNVKIEAILGIDKNSFLALLKTKGKEPALTLGNSDDLKKDNKVFAIGTNEAGEITVSEGTVTNILDYAPGRRIIDSSISVPENFRGGPVLNSSGQVLGITIVLERGLKFIIPANLLKILPKKAEVKFKDMQHEDYLSTLEGSLLAAKISSLLDETGKAQKYLEKVIKDAPANIEAQSLLASVFVRQRNYEAAISAYNKVIELDANRDDAYYGLGLVYFNMRRFKEATPPFEKAVQINPEYKEAYFYIASSYEESKDFAKAAESYEKYVHLKPEKQGTAYWHLGLCRFELGQFDAAAAAFQEALKENPQDTFINDRLAQAYQKSGQYEKAEQVYTNLAQLKPEYKLNYYRTILVMYDSAGMRDKAIEIAKKIVEMNPKDSDSLFNLGNMYYKQKRYNEAAEAFTKAIQIRPNFEYAYLSLGNCYLELKQWSKCVETYSKYVEIAPDNADAWYLIGASYIQLKKYESSLEPLLKAVEIRPDFGNAYYNLAITYLGLQDNRRARETYRKLLTIDPGLAEKLKKHLR